MYCVTIRWKPLIASIVLSMGTGALSGLLIRSNTGIYEQLTLPPLSPPSFLFPIAWGILYFLMGISAYLVYCSGSQWKKQALTVYLVQLLVNFCWSLIFFNLQAFFVAFLWLVLLWVLILVMLRLFYRCRKAAAYLQIPYLLWVTFAAYLSCGVWLLN
ncbi:TspO/MBR family protein [Faecalispora anaeroviscerum]|uniref:TspO/MBR family protein n=1 Tax=Faecalispora anaeroviscerum TaxID=2991836 RepID=UPI0024BB1045|nr:TspO/MBR family protein [Faecalispora anaeroviscerum]